MPGTGFMGVIQAVRQRMPEPGLTFLIKSDLRAAVLQGSRQVVRQLEKILKIVLTTRKYYGIV